MDRFDPCGTDECKKRCDSYGVACDDIMADEIDRLRAELAACQQDAERYRWLRGTVPESSSRWARWRLECWISGAWHELRGLHLDTCIDAARKGEGE